MAINLSAIQCRQLAGVPAQELKQYNYNGKLSKNISSWPDLELESAPFGSWSFDVEEISSETLLVLHGIVMQKKSKTLTVFGVVVDLCIARDDNMDQDFLICVVEDFTKKEFHKYVLFAEKFMGSHSKFPLDANVNAVTLGFFELGVIFWKDNATFSVEDIMAGYARVYFLCMKRKYMISRV
ncbi:unnamed protein product [Calypogeia fissa]